MFWPDGALPKGSAGKICRYGIRADLRASAIAGNDVVYREFAGVEVRYLIFRHKRGFDEFDRFSTIHWGQLDRRSPIKLDASTLEELLKALGDRGQAMQPGDVAIEMLSRDLESHRFWTVGTAGIPIQLRNAEKTLLMAM